MPKRIIDGEGLWRSDKLSTVEPAGRRAEYANLVPLALSNGVFEANPRRIWTMVYSYNRPDVTIEDVVQILDEFERVKLLFRWTASDGKVWGYWIGIDKPGRLPGKSRRGKNEAVGPEPPQDSMRMFMDSSGIHTETIEQPSGTDLRLGLGLGSGTDSNGIREVATLSSTKFNPTEVATILCKDAGWSGHKMIVALRDAIEWWTKQEPEVAIEQIGESLVNGYRAYQAEKGTFAVLPQKYFEQGLYQGALGRRGNGRATPGVDLVARTLAQLEAQ